ncbi:MAG: hypothetical protein HKM95_04140 [Inquilinus sp.]|nr:hypothetical protein [Inquilinus sp.]
MTGLRMMRDGGRRRLAFASLGLALTTATAAAAQERSFTIRNESEVALQSVYASPIYSKYWGSDLLNNTLAPGQIRELRMRSQDECFFDLRFEDVNGQETKFWAEDLCARPILEYR